MAQSITAIKPLERCGYGTYNSGTQKIWHSGSHIGTKGGRYNVRSCTSKYAPRSNINKRSGREGSGSRPRCTFFSHSLLCSKNNYYFVGFEPLHKKDPIALFSCNINLVPIIEGEANYCDINL